MTVLTQPAYAKLNLTLDILGSRPDGYHELDGVMQMISLYDEVEVSVSKGEGVSLQCNIKALETEGYQPKVVRTNI